METAAYSITIVHTHSSLQQDTIMANTSSSSAGSSSCLDYSAHSIQQQDIMSTESSLPLSPNGVDEYPSTTEDSTTQVSPSSSSSSSSSSTRKKNVSKTLHNPHGLPCAPSCASTCTAETDLSSLSATLHTTYTKSVQFSPVVRVKDTLSRHELTEDERSHYWLADHDFATLKKQNQQIILATLRAQKKQSRQAKTFDSDCDSDSDSDCSIADTISTMDDDHEDEDEHCLRGLEAGLPNENLRRKSYRFAALEEVLLEQEDQYFAGIYDEEAIADVYAEVTVECRFRAEFKGIQDAKDIEEYLRREEPQLAFPKPATSFHTTSNNHNDCEEDDEFALE